MGFFLRWSWSAVILLSAGCQQPLNAPYPAEEARANIYYDTFSERPKHLDPAVSYSSDEYRIISLVYEPPLQYSYRKKPYTLEPLTAASLPKITLFDREGHILPSNTPLEQVAYTEYEIEIKPGIYYQPHPAFAQHGDQYLYHNLKSGDVEDIHTPFDFKELATRELTASDYVYQIKRLVHPELHSPIAGLMQQYIIGLRELSERLQRDYRTWKDQGGEGFFDLRPYKFEGAYVVDRYRYRIRIKGIYPQFLYWLAMPFFAPLPWEADAFYHQESLIEKNLTLDWYPVGTGPFMVVENNPNRRIRLLRNPNYHTDIDPTTGEQLPLIEEIQYLLEREAIPAWNKFLQGYYEASGVSSDVFDQAIAFGAEGQPVLTEELQRKGIQLKLVTASSIFYLAFNMLDPVVGGLDERHRKLRQAISIALNFEEYISIFLNGRGAVAHGPIPPGIFGYRGDYNPYTHREINGRVVRRPIEEAKRLLAEAGYPDGLDPETGKPLVLYYDTVGGGADDKARFDWYRKQLRKLGIQLVIRATDYNRFQDKIGQGNAQLFSWGWNADYPDPENFLFLFHCRNSKALHGGENAANYCNPEFDVLFEKMRQMDNTQKRFDLIRKMISLLQRDAPWVFGFYPKSFLLHHAWLKNVHLNPMANNRLKYFKLDPDLRFEKRRSWNRPNLWPLLFFALVLALLIVPMWLTYRKRMEETAL